MNQNAVNANLYRNPGYEVSIRDLPIRTMRRGRGNKCSAPPGTQRKHVVWPFPVHCVPGLSVAGLRYRRGSLQRFSSANWSTGGRKLYPYDQKNCFPFSGVRQDLPWLQRVIQFLLQLNPTLRSSAGAIGANTSP